MSMKINKTNVFLVIALSAALGGVYMTTNPTSVNNTKVYARTVRVEHRSTVSVPNRQAKKQDKARLIKSVKNRTHKRRHQSDWYADGLSKRQQKARAKVVFMESRGDWKATNGKCWGRFQLLPAYLGRSHGHINLDHKHQTQVADQYVQKRYHTWTRALSFHYSHGWY